MKKCTGEQPLHHAHRDKVADELTRNTRRGRPLDRNRAESLEPRQLLVMKAPASLDQPMSNDRLRVTQWQCALGLAPHAGEASTPATNSHPPHTCSATLGSHQALRDDASAPLASTERGMSSFWKSSSRSNSKSMHWGSSGQANVPRTCSRRMPTTYNLDRCCGNPIRSTFSTSNRLHTHAVIQGGPSAPRSRGPDSLTTSHAHSPGGKPSDVPAGCHPP